MHYPTIRELRNGMTILVIPLEAGTTPIDDIVAITEYTSHWDIVFLDPDILSATEEHFV